MELPRHVERCPLRDLKAPRANAALDGERLRDEPALSTHATPTARTHDDAPQDKSTTRGTTPRTGTPPRELAPSQLGAVPVDPILAAVVVNAEAWNAPARSAPATTAPLRSWDRLTKAAREAAKTLSPAEARALRLSLALQRAQREEQKQRGAWVFFALLALAAVLVVLVLARRDRGSSAATGAVPPQASRPPAAPVLGAVRPAYNPSLHGSLEDYRAAFGHLPPPPPTTDAGAPRVGLDRSSVPQAWRPQP